MDVRVKRRARRRSHNGPLRIKWWRLKGVKQRIFQHKILEGGIRQSHGSANDMWERMAYEIKKVAKETLGVSRGFGPTGKESWWWNDNVQSKVWIKRECFKDWSRVKMPKLGINIR